MIASTYDPTGKAQDVFAYADTKLSKNGGTLDEFAVLNAEKNFTIKIQSSFQESGINLNEYEGFTAIELSSKESDDSANSTLKIDPERVHFDINDSEVFRLTDEGIAIASDVVVSKGDEVEFATMDFGYRKDGLSVFQPSTLRGIQIPTEPDMAASREYVDAAVAGAGIPVVTTAGTGAAYTATVEGITELTAGQMLVIIPHTSSTSQAVTLNVNNLGAKNIWRYTSKSSGQISSGYNTQWIASDIPLMLVYDSAHQCWFSISLSKPYAYDLDGILNVLKGGTGQESLTSGSYLVGNGTAAVQLKTPAQVREDIGAAGKPKTLQISIPASGWDASAKTQTVTATGVTATNAVTPSPAPASWEAAGTAGVRCTAQAADSLTFTCSEVPTADLTYNVLVQEVQ